MTNGDKIRSMTDEELAEWYGPRMLCRDCPKKRISGFYLGCDLAECNHNALIWLQSEEVIKNVTDQTT